MHIHHIIPKHMGGTDDPSNLVELTIQEHADAHRKLFEKYGHWQDELAWKGLVGLITTEEVARLAIVYSNKTRAPIDKQKLSQSLKRAYREGRKQINPLNVAAIRDAVRVSNSTRNNDFNRRIVTCPHCRKSGGLSGMNRHHFNNCKTLNNHNGLIITGELT